MVRIAPLAVLVALALAPAARAAAPASAVLLACERGAEPAAELEGRMAAVAGAARLQMRFTLQARTRGRRGYRRVAAPGFDEWTTAAAGITRYVYTRRVEALIGPAHYRARIRFRWQDAQERTIARAVRFTRPCRVPDPRPNLTIRSLSIEPAGEPELRRYVAVVRNAGRGAAGEFELRIGELASTTIDGLAARRMRIVELLGPACEPAASVTAVVDADDAVDERSEADNAFTRACP